MLDGFSGRNSIILILFVIVIVIVRLLLVLPIMIATIIECIFVRWCSWCEFLWVLIQFCLFGFV